MRYLGLDLGTKTLGVAITDKTKVVANFLKVIRFSENNYLEAINSLMPILKDYQIEKIILGNPKNMNNSRGFASKRSLEFKKLLEKYTDIPIILIDERLSTTEAENILIDADLSRKKRKQVIDSISEQIILDTYLKMEENLNE